MGVIGAFPRDFFVLDRASEEGEAGGGSWTHHYFAE